MALENFGGELDPRLGRRLPRPRSRDRYFEKESPGREPGAQAGPRAQLRAQPAPPTRARPARRSQAPGNFQKGLGGWGESSGEGEAGAAETSAQVTFPIFSSA